MPTPRPPPSNSGIRGSRGRATANPDFLFAGGGAKPCFISPNILIRGAMPPNHESRRVAQGVAQTAHRNMALHSGK